MSSIPSSASANSTGYHLGTRHHMGQATTVPHTHSNHLRCTTCFHPPQEHFLIPFDKPGMSLKENRFCLQLECPNPKYVPQTACTRPSRGREVLHGVSRTTRWSSFHVEQPKSDGRPRWLMGEPGTRTRGMQHEKPTWAAVCGSRRKEE